MLAGYDPRAKSVVDSNVVRVEPGETVTWILDSGAHTATAHAEVHDRQRRIPDDTEAWDSGTLSEPGATFSRTFETEGVYVYFCRPHETEG